MWVPWDHPGLEHARLLVDASGALVDSLMLGVENGQPFRASYSLRCDSAWRTRELRVVLLDDRQLSLHLLADGLGHWTTPDGVPIPLLDGCVDPDLSATPFTNTLPIRRLNWHRGKSAELAMTYVAVPSLRLSVDRQRYTCLEEPETTSRFFFESLPSGFTAELEVDQDGLVLDYPGLFRRVWSS